MTYAQELFDLTGRVVVLTGGAGLLGRGYAAALVRSGAVVVLADIDVAGGTAAAAAAGKLGHGRAAFVETDVTSKSSVQEMVAQVMAEHGRIDGLVNNCALDPKFDRASLGTHGNSFEDFPIEHWEHSIKVNLTGMFLCAQAVARPLLVRGGAIVNVSSIYGMVGPDQRLYVEPGMSPPFFKPVSYSVTKSGVLGLTRYLATYWAGKNIRVNSLTPGGVHNDQTPGFVDRYASRTPLGRMARIDEYCGALLFLLSDASSYMTGANLVIDGGWTSW